LIDSKVIIILEEKGGKMSQKFQILWADDEIDLLKPHILFLREKGCDITTVNSGVDAIEEVEEKNFDVVFLDEMMPGMTGLEVQEHMKRAGMDVPVIFVTAHEEEGPEENALRAGAVGFLRKPFTDEALVRLIRTTLQHQREPASSRAAPGE
jgi:CheY-like chemotaxis protein